MIKWIDCHFDAPKFFAKNLTTNQMASRLILDVVHLICPPSMVNFIV
ncbi:hypothetical protein [Vibrio phage vB_pir03]|nr:hypothetical protein [Vibrio phage vB_pir03]